MTLSAMKIGLLLRELNRLDPSLHQHVDKTTRHARMLAAQKIVDARLLLQTIGKFQQENLAHRTALKHLVGEVESLSRSTKEPSLRQQLANIRGQYVNLDRKLEVLYGELKKVADAASRRLHEPGRTDDPPGGTTPLTDLIHMVLQVIALLIQRRKAATK